MGQSCSPPDRQDNANPVRQSQIPIMGEARKPAMADPCCVAKCEDLLDAVRLCAHISNYSHSHICEQLGIDNGHWTRIMQGRAHFPTRKLRKLMELCGNLAPLQFLSLSMGYELTQKSLDPRDARIQVLEQELARRAA